MWVFKKSLLYGLFFFIIPLHAHITRIHSLKEFERAIKAGKIGQKKNLILLDIDDTLEKAGDVVGYAFDPMFDAAVHEKLRQKFPGLSDEELKGKLQYYQSIEWSTEDKELVEPSSVQLINELKKDGDIVLALTSTPPGKFYEIDNFPSWRYLILKKMGIVFSQQLGNAVLTELGKTPFPELYKGMIFGGEWSKGDVLKAFFAHFPQLRHEVGKVFFLDDQLSNHEHMDSAGQDLGVSFEGYHYTFVSDQFKGWKDAQHQHLSDFYFQRGLKQWDYLLEHNKWLKDKEIGNVIIKKNKKGKKIKNTVSCQNRGVSERNFCLHIS